MLQERGAGSDSPGDIWLRGHMMSVPCTLHRVCCHEVLKGLTVVTHDVGDLAPRVF